MSILYSQMANYCCNSRYHALQNGTNAFLELYWYSASLGDYAVAGLSVHTYFTFVGSGLGMVGCDRYKSCGICAESRLLPYPSYYLAVLHKRLVDTNVLSVTGASGDHEPLVFAHCARKSRVTGGVTLMFVNPSLHPVKLDVNIDNNINDSSSLGSFEQYTLTPPQGNVNSSSVLLNGQLLALTSNDTLPLVSPAVHAAADAVLVPASSVGFVVFPHAHVRACTKTPVNSVE